MDFTGFSTATDMLTRSEGDEKHVYGTSFVIYAAARHFW